MHFSLKRTVVIILLLTLGFLLNSFTLFLNGPHPYVVPNYSLEDKQYIPPENPITAEGVWLGRLLFYDKLLSGNYKQSCGSCHKQELCFTDGLSLAVGSKGDTLRRNTMPILNLIYHSNRFFWDGHAYSLEKLVRFPVTHPQEMDKDTIVLVKELKNHEYYPALFSYAFPDQEISMDLVSKSIAQFMRIIVTKHARPKNIFKTYGAVKDNLKNSKLIYEKSLGGSLYRFNATCTYCHEGDLLGGLDFANNFINSKDTAMVVPSLINLSYTGPYMHDGRFVNFKKIFEHYEQIIPDLPKNNPTITDGLPCLIEDYDKENFSKLISLFKDTTVLTNQLYSDPYKLKGFNWKINPYLPQ